MPESLRKFELKDGGELFIETSAAPTGGGAVKIARDRDVVDSGSKYFEEAFGRLKPICAVIIGTLKGVADGPDEITVKFGVKFSGEAGVIITKTAVEANFQVGLKWTRPSGKG